MNKKAIFIPAMTLVIIFILAVLLIFGIGRLSANLSFGGSKVSTSATASLSFIDVFGVNSCTSDAQCSLNRLCGVTSSEDVQGSCIDINSDGTYANSRTGCFQHKPTANSLELYCSPFIN